MKGMDWRRAESRVEVEVREVRDDCRMVDHCAGFSEVVVQCLICMFIFHVAKTTREPWTAWTG